MRLKITDSDRKRFWAKVRHACCVAANGADHAHDPDSCLLWQGATQSSGYGCFWLCGSSRLAHRVSLVLSGVPLAKSLFSLHNDGCPKICVHPKHLRPGDQKENMNQHYLAQARAIAVDLELEP